MTGSRFTVSRETTLNAQRLRREATPFERLVWSRLNRNQLARRQHAAGPFILDFYSAPLRLGVEIDGDSHGVDGASEADARRTDYLAAKGVALIRFWNSEVRESLDGVVERIRLECETRARELGR